jgi:hypothetical protein
VRIYAILPTKKGKGLILQLKDENFVSHVVNIFLMIKAQPDPQFPFLPALLLAGEIKMFHICCGLKNLSSKFI